MMMRIIRCVVAALWQFMLHQLIGSDRYEGIR